MCDAVLAKTGYGGHEIIKETAQAARVHGVPRKTLVAYVQRFQELDVAHKAAVVAEEGVPFFQKGIGRFPVLMPEEEEALLDRVAELAFLGHPLTLDFIQAAVKRHLQNQGDVARLAEFGTDGTPGWDWWDGFRGRHKDRIALLKPQKATPPRPALPARMHEVNECRPAGLDAAPAARLAPIQRLYARPPGLGVRQVGRVAAEVS